MKTVDIRKIKIEDIQLIRTQLRQQGVLILDHGWHQMIQNCTENGISVVMPNFLMSPHLIVQTIVRLNRTMLVTSHAIWKTIREAFDAYPAVLGRMSVMLF